MKNNEAVTVCMLNAPETVCLLFVLNKIDAVANMVYGVEPPEELQKHLLDANSRFVFTLDMSFFTRVGAHLLKDMKPLPLPEDSSISLPESHYTVLPLPLLFGEQFIQLLHQNIPQQSTENGKHF